MQCGALIKLIFVTGAQTLSKRGSCVTTMIMIENDKLIDLPEDSRSQVDLQCLEYNLLYIGR